MILVTGASRGLGRAIRDRLTSRGVDVFGVARNVDGVPAPAMRCDVSSSADVTAVARCIRRLDVPLVGLVNAAGIASMNLAVMTPPEVARSIVHTNLLGTIHCCQLLAPLLLRRRAGVIVNFSTIAVALALEGESIYAASKAGVEAFTRAFAREVADFNVTVNCIAPGPIETGLLDGVPAARIDEVVSRQIIPRRFTADAVCDLVELLLDHRGGSLSGQILHVGGA